MDKYTEAVTRDACPKPGCNKGPSEKCNTSTGVHEARRDAAIIKGYWSPTKALAGEYGDLAGCPLAALKGANPTKNNESDLEETSS